jgi:hypothetical protein
MRISGVIQTVFFAIVFCWANVPIVGQITNQSGPQTGQTVSKRQGFFDYALGKINPQNKDYGASMEMARNSIVQYTIDDLYFWSNAVTLVLLTGLAAILLLQWRVMEKRELIAVSLITQLWNGRVSDRMEIGRRTEQFNQLVELHKQESARLARIVRDLADDKTSTLPDPAGPQVSPPSPVDQQNVHLLQRRVEALQNSERNLNQRLNQVTALLEEERRRNPSLKGALKNHK